jgi:hypothetical protein
MNGTDFVILIACVSALATMLVGSKVLRAIFWEIIRHPFRPSRIEIENGQMVVTHPQPLHAEDQGTRSAAGAH